MGAYPIYCALASGADIDRVLTEVARHWEPTARYWWVRVHCGPFAGARCLICQGLICTWDGAAWPTRGAWDDIEAHGRMHMQEHLRQTRDSLQWVGGELPTTEPDPPNHPTPQKGKK